MIAMNRTRIALIAAFFLLIVGFAYAQEPQDQTKPKPEESRPETKPQAAPPEHKNQEEAKPSPQQERAKPQKLEKQENSRAPKATNPAHEEKGQASQQGGVHPGGKSAHIPDSKFKAGFGRQHSIKVNQVIKQTTIVPGQTQFVYSGYTFIILDAWPAEWLFTDDCYIDYVDDDYFLFDPFHPGIRVALFVVG
jgi:cytoskeletal protein RodZ